MTGALTLNADPTQAMHAATKQYVDDNFVSFAPQTLTPVQQEQARNNIGAASRYDAVLSRAEIEHFRTGGLIYDVITVKSPKLQTVKKVFAPGVDHTGAVDKMSARAMALATGRRILVNADGFENADGSPGFGNVRVRPVGLQIADGVLYQDWRPEDDRTQAIIMMQDGFLVEANKDDGISGAQWIASGAQWSIGWGYVCVRGGAAVDLTGIWPGSAVSARTIIGQRANGDIVIVIVEGKTGEYGITPNGCGTLMASLGCQIAYICDGGGSSQCWWLNTYAVPSSDMSGNFPIERGIPTFIAIEPDITPLEYDSGAIPITMDSGYGPLGGAGHAVTFRHKGPNVYVTARLSASPAIPAMSDGVPGSATVATNALPVRYRSEVDGPLRFPCQAPGGRPASLNFGPASGSLIAYNQSSVAVAWVAGSGFWPAPFANLS